MSRLQRPNFLATLVIALTFCCGLVLWQLPQSASAQNTGNLTLNQNGAKIAYGNGVEFKVVTTASGNQPAVNSAKIKVRFGTRGQEVVYDANVAGGTATFFASEDKTQLVTGMPLSWVWQLSNGKTNFETPASVVIYEDQRHRWIQRDGDKVTVRWYSGDSSYGALMYQLAVDSLATYKRRFNMDTSEQIYISIYDSSSAFFQTFPGHPSWAGGFARYGGQEIVVISPQAQNEGVLIGEGIPHELSHAALFQFLGRPAPVWLDEGFAVYNQNIIAIREYDEILQQAYRNNALMSFNTLNNRWPSDENSARLAYAQGRSFITFLINNYGNEVWSNVLDSLRRNDSDGAFQENFGITMTEMETLWKEKELGRNKTKALPEARKRGPVASVPSRGSTLAPGNSQTSGTVAATSSDNWGLLAGLVGAVIALAMVGSIVFVALSNRKRQQERLVYIAPHPGQPASFPTAYPPVADWQPGNFGSYGYNPPPAPAPMPNYPSANMLSMPPSWTPPAPASSAQPLTPTNGPVYFQSPPEYSVQPPRPASAPVYDDPFDLIMQNFNKKPAAPPPVPPYTDPYGSARNDAEK